MSKNKLSKTEVRTFLRLLAFARPYWLRLAVGAVCSILGGSSIIALLVVAQNLLGFIFDSRSMLDGDKSDRSHVVL